MVNEWNLETSIQATQIYKSDVLGDLRAFSTCPRSLRLVLLVQGFHPPPVGLL